MIADVSAELDPKQATDLARCEMLPLVGAQIKRYPG
jgi:hypothetical protein